MSRTPLFVCAIVLAAAPLGAQEKDQGTAVIRLEGALLSSPGLVSRMTGGVGAAFGGTIGRRFVLSVEVLYHAFPRYNTEEYAAGVHTDVTLQGEYALTADGPYHTQVLALLGHPRLPRRAAGPDHVRAAAGDSLLPRPVLHQLHRGW